MDYKAAITGTATDADTQALVTLEQEAQTLRAELNGVNNA
jgi:hypothetical protein